MADDALVGNAADPKQVKKAAKKEKQTRDEQLSDLRALLASETGRRVLWRFLEECGTFKSIFEQSSKIYYNSGRQDVGHWLLAELTEAKPDAYLDLIKERS